MRIRFEYNYNMEYYFHTYSELTINGSGIWDLDEQNFASEVYSNKKDDETFEEYCLNYFDNELNLYDNSIKFNLEDLKQLENYCNNESDRYL